MGPLGLVWDRFGSSFRPKPEVDMCWAVAPPSSSLCAGRWHRLAAKRPGGGTA
ncbi:unnamed protein product [Musa textilis]